MSALGKQSLEVFKLGRGGKLAEKEQINALLKTVSVLGNESVYQGGHIVAAIFKLSVYRRFFSLAYDVSVSVSDVCNARHNTRAVDLAKTFLYSIVLKGIGRYGVCAIGRRNDIFKICDLF